MISHPYKEGFTAEFDYTGTKDPTAWLAIEAALDFVEEIDADAMRTHNYALARQAASMIRSEWGTEPLAPDEMLGCLVTLRLPIQQEACIEAAASMRRFLLDEHQKEVPVFPFGEYNWVRISAQVYNERSDYDALANALLSDAHGSL